MADQSAANFTTLQHDPGNPIFPTLPGAGDPIVGKISDFGRGASLLFPFFEDQTDVVQSATGGVGFGGWFVNQIWVTPTPIDFGDISGDKNVGVTLFSTYLDTVTLDSVVIPVDGIDISDPASSPIFPLGILSFNDTVLTFTATLDGPQTFDDDITFTVEGLSFEIRTLGRRVLLLFGEPENGAIETLNFATNLMRSKDGKEQAFALRLAPWSNIQYTIRTSSDIDFKRTEIMALLLGGAPVLPYGVQLWWEAEKISSPAASTDTVINIDTTNMQIAIGETVVFTTPSRVNVVATVLSFTTSTITLEDQIGTLLPEGTYGMPVRFGRLTSDPQINVARKNMQDTGISLRTEEDVDIANVDPNYFDFHTVESPARPIIRKRCTRGNLQGVIRRETSQLDSITGKLFVTGTESIGEWVSDAVVYCNSKAEIRAWREFLHHLKGSWGTFYLPSFQNDLPLDSAIALGGNTFDIPFMNISGLLNGQAPVRDLRVVLEDGSVEYKRITSVVDNGNGTETITVDSVLGSVGFSQPENTFISWMYLVRLDDDAATFTHRYLGEAELTFSVRSVKE